MPLSRDRSLNDAHFGVSQSLTSAVHDFLLHLLSLSKMNFPFSNTNRDTKEVTNSSEQPNLSSPVKQATSVYMTEEGKQTLIKEIKEELINHFVENGSGSKNGNGSTNPDDPCNFMPLGVDPDLTSFITKVEMIEMVRDAREHAAKITEAYDDETNDRTSLLKDD